MQQHMQLGPSCVARVSRVAEGQDVSCVMLDIYVYVYIYILDVYIRCILDVSQNGWFFEGKMPTWDDYWNHQPAIDTLW